MKKRFTKLFAAIALLVFMMPSLVGWGQTRTETTIASWGKVSIAANTAIKASGGDSNNNGTAKYISTKAMTSAGTYCYYGNSAGGAVITFSNLDLSGYEDITMTFYTRASQRGKMQISWSSNGTDYTVLNEPSITTSEAQKTSDEIPNTATHIKLAHDKTSGSLYFGTIVIKGTVSSGGAAATTTTIDHSGISNTDVNTSTAAGSLSASVTSGGNAVQGASVTWSGNNDAVATINSSTGAITLHSMGTVTFTASYEGVTNQYQPSFDTYEMTVIDSQYSISNLTFTAQCNGTGTASTNDHAAWVVTSDGTESTYDPTSGIHYGTNGANVTYVQLTTSDIKGEIAKVTVNTRDAQACATVSVTVGGTAYAYTGTGTATATNTSADYTFTGTGSGEIVVRIDRDSSMNKAIYVKSVIVYYIPSNDPSITASDLNIDYDAENGAIEYTLQNGTGNVSATITSGDWLTLGTITSSTVPFTCSANTSNTARTATVTLSYTGASDKVVTITQAANPNLANIGALTAQTAGNYTVSLTNALVTYVNGTNAYLEDASGAVLLYGCAGTLAVGDKITGTANVTYTVYNNLPEVTAFTLTGYTLTQNNTVTPTEVTIATLESNFTSYISRYVKIVGATVTSAFNNRNSTIEQSGSSIVLRDQNNPGTLTTTVNDIVTVTAHPSIYSTTHQIAVYEQSQIVVAKVDPTITFNNGSVRVGQTLDLSTLFTSNSNGAVTYSITAGGSYATLSGSELTGTAEGSVTVKAAQAETTSYNEGEATATITVNPALVLSSIAVTTAPTKTTYNEGETFDPTGMVVTATYTDNSTNAVTGYTYLPDGALATTDTEITISYTENNVTKTTTQAITVNEVVDYATLPFNYEGGVLNDFLGMDGTSRSLNDQGSYAAGNAPYQIKFTATGDYLQVKTNAQPGTVTIGVKMVGGNTSSTITVQGSSDGVNFTDIQVLTISGSQNAVLSLETTQSFAATDRYVRLYFNKGSNVGVGPITIATYVAPGNSVPVWSALPTPTIAVNEEYELNLSTYVTGTPTPTITLATSVSNNLYEFVNGSLVFQPTAAGTYEFTFTATNSEGSASATLTVTAVEAATYTLATAITPGRHYVIAASTSNVTKAMGGKNASKDYYNAIDASIDGNTITVPANSEIQEFVIVGPNAQGYYYIYDPVAGGYLYASSDNNNDLSYQTPNDDNGLWKIDFTENTVTAQGTNTHNLLRYNSGNPRFSCYTSGQTAIAFYEKNETTPQYDFYMDIAAWSSNASDKWYFIALPVSGTYTLSDSYMVTGNYDLYRLNNITWENYKNNEHADFTTLNNGTGYLYANSANTTLHFSGDINEFTTEGNANVKNLSDGWNLIGNPYNIPIYINKPYYRMNATGTAVETANDITSEAIPAGTGVIVKATGDSESVTFSTTAPEGANNGGNIQMSVLKNNVRGNDVQDKAIISFNEGSKLEKFQLFEGNAKLYIPQNGEDYAIAFSNRQGDMLLNFKTTEAGMYTISFEGDNMDLKGVYLIDMLAEEKIDLSVDPSYTFIGSPADKAERFKIVFRGFFDGVSDDIFAFQSGSDIIVSGEGELQIFDVMGRRVKTQYISGVQTVNVNAQGVYIMKLNEKTQKIIVR